MMFDPSIKKQSASPNKTRKFAENLKKATDATIESARNVTDGILRGVEIGNAPLSSSNPNKETFFDGIRNLLSQWELLPEAMRPREKYFDLQMRSATKQSGVALSMENTLNNTQVALEVPRYKLSHKAMRRFVAWKESGGKVGSANYDINDKKFMELVNSELQLEKNNGKLMVLSDSGLKNTLVIELDVADKSEEEIREIVEGVLKSLNIKDSKLVKSSAHRLYTGEPIEMNSGAVNKSKEASDESNGEVIEPRVQEKNGEVIQPRSQDLTPVKENAKDLSSETLQGLEKLKSEVLQSSNPSEEVIQPFNNSAKNKTKIKLQDVKGLNKGISKEDYDNLERKIGAASMGLVQNTEFALTNALTKSIAEQQFRSPSELQNEVVENSEFLPLLPKNNLERSSSQIHGKRRISSDKIPHEVFKKLAEGIQWSNVASTDVNSTQVSAQDSINKNFEKKRGRSA